MENLKIRFLNMYFDQKTGEVYLKIFLEMFPSHINISFEISTTIKQVIYTVTSKIKNPDKAKVCQAEM